MCNGIPLVRTGAISHLPFKVGNSATKFGGCVPEVHRAAGLDYIRIGVKIRYRPIYLEVFTAKSIDAAVFIGIGKRSHINSCGGVGMLKWRTGKGLKGSVVA